MNILVIGTGYVGLTTSACLASLGHRVVGYDVDARKIAMLKAGTLPIYEEGLEDLARRCGDRLSFSDTLEDAAREAEIIFLAVGTPASADGRIDLTAIEAAARSVAAVMNANATVVVKSTVVPGTAKRLREAIAEARGGLDFSVASNPEFMREGTAVNDFLCPDRIVLGTDDSRALAHLRAVYAPLAKSGATVVETTTVNAEMAKYASNAMLALRIGFINGIADLCEAVSGDVETVARIVGADSRIGSHFLRAGPGFGGSCFPKDIMALAAIGRTEDARQPLIETLIAENERRQQRLVARALEMLSAPEGARVGVLGTAFKAGTDDLRHAIAVPILSTLLKAGAKITVFDPAAGHATQELFPQVEVAQDPYDAAQEAELLLILTEWPEIAALDPARLAVVMRGTRILDYRNLLNPDAAQQAGFDYYGIGRGNAHAGARHRKPSAPLLAAAE